MDSTHTAVQHSGVVVTYSNINNPKHHQSENPAPRQKPSLLFNTVNINLIAIRCLWLRSNRLSDSVIVAAVGALLRWLDHQLNSPIEVADRDGIRIVRIFQCLHYVKNERQKSFCSFLKHRQAKKSVRIEHTTVSLKPMLVSNHWMHAVVNLAIPGEYLQDIRQNKVLFNRIIFETVKLLSRDGRFILLKYRYLPLAIEIDPRVKDIAATLFKKGSGTNEDYTLIWRNLAVYQQLIDEGNPFIQFFHSSNLFHFKQMKKSTKGEHRYPVGLPPEKSTQFDLHKLKAFLRNEGNGDKLWRYLYKHGDRLFEALYSLKPELKTNYAGLHCYLNFLVGLNSPLPPTPKILQALLSMQGYLPDTDPLPFLDAGNLNSPVLQLALAYYGDKPVITEEDIDDFLLVMYRDQDHGIHFDKNRKKQGWRWLVNKCRHWEVAYSQFLIRKQITWKRFIGDIEIDNYRFREISNHCELHATAARMRICIENYVSECVEDKRRFFTIQEPDDSQIIAVIGVSLVDSNWAIDDARGFGNSAPDYAINEPCLELIDHMNLKS